MYKFPITAIILCFSLTLFGQPLEGLVALYDFDQCNNMVIVDRVANNNGAFMGASQPDCVCGIENDAIRLDGDNDYIEFDGFFQDLFNTKDFSISFYLKNGSAIGTQRIFSKRFDCDEERYFEVTYNSSTSQLRVVVQENASKKNNISYQLPEGICWFHIVIVRESNITKLYVNAEEVGSAMAIARVDITNGADFQIAGAADQACSPEDVPFAGAMDNLLIYKRALAIEDIEELYLAPDRVFPRDTILFIGEFIQPAIFNTCATTFNWTPTEDIDDPTLMEPLITPEESGSYSVQMIQAGCVSVDSIRVTVIDPSDVGCDEIFLPKAFTPNADGLNDTYGILNPFAVEGLISLEIVDRWGSVIYQSANPNERWDGTFAGQEVNPGIFLYRLRYLCDGVEEIRTGSLTLLR